MVRYFCDRCGKELTKDKSEREILLLDCTIRYFVPREWDDKTHQRILCNACFYEFEDWLCENAKETKT